MTYPEIFPPDTRVIIVAGKGEGTDQEWNGYTGTVLKWHGCSWASIKMDKHRRYWPRGPVTIIGHNLQLLPAAGQAPRG